MNDLIKREEVIDLLNKLARYNFSLSDGYEFYLKALRDTSDKIIELPSVQPEIIRCKDCKHRVYTEDGESDPHDIVCNYYMSDGFDETDFCSYAERKE